MATSSRAHRLAWALAACLALAGAAWTAWLGLFEWWLSWGPPTEDPSRHARRAAWLLGGALAFSAAAAWSGWRASRRAR